jgi:hypothetical protein
MDASSNPTISPGGSSHTTRTRILSEGGPSLSQGQPEGFATEFGSCRSPLPVFTDEWCTPLPLAFQVPLATAWAEVFSRIGGRVPSFVQVHQRVVVVDSGEPNPQEAEYSCDRCGMLGHFADQCFRQIEPLVTQGSVDPVPPAPAAVAFSTPANRGASPPPPPRVEPAVLGKTPAPSELHTPASVIPIVVPESPTIYVSDSDVSYSPEYTPATPLYGEYPSEDDDDLPFTPKRRFRRTGNKREYLRRFSGPA